MSFLLRLCLGLFLLAPALVYAEVLETPGNRDKLSGLGLIRGWKCDAGDITVKLSDADGNAVGTVPMVYGSERPDTEGVCGDTNNGFVAIYNWANLGSGAYTAQAYDDDMAFGAEHSFTVTKAGRDDDEMRNYLLGAEARVEVPNFPVPGETTTFEWNQSTQHLEMTMWTAAIDLGVCEEMFTVHPGEMCSGSISVAGTNFNFTFTVDADGQACISGGTPVDGCYPVSLPEVLDQIGVDVTRNDDGSWTIHSLPVPESVEPVVDLGACEVGMTVNPGAMCSGSVLGINFTFSVNADGQACVDAGGIIDECFDTSEALNRAIDFAGAAATKNDNGSWTIDRIP